MPSPILPLLLAGEGRGEAEGGPLASGCDYDFPPHCRFSRFSATNHSDIFIDGVSQSDRSGQRATFGRNPYLYIEERERHPVFPNLCKASRPTLYKNLNDGMSQCDRAGLSPLPSGRGDIDVYFLSNLKPDFP